jgi:hypothetical protein
MPMLEDMMMKQGMQGQQAPQGAPQGMNQGSNNFGGPPASQFAGGMDPEMLQQIVQMMQATQGQSPHERSPNSMGAGGPSFGDERQFDSNLRSQLPRLDNVLYERQQMGSLGGMPPRPAGKLGMPDIPARTHGVTDPSGPSGRPSPSANSNIRGTSSGDGYTGSAGIQAATDADRASGAMHPSGWSSDSPMAQQMNQASNRAQVGDTSGGYNQNSPRQDGTLAPQSGGEEMALQQNGSFDRGNIRISQNEYGEWIYEPIRGRSTGYNSDGKRGGY